MSRPFGVAMLFAGVDQNGPQLFHLDPSGTFIHCLAKSIGAASDGAEQNLKEHYHAVSLLEFSNINNHFPRTWLFAKLRRLRSPFSSKSWKRSWLAPTLNWLPSRRIQTPKAVRWAVYTVWTKRNWTRWSPSCKRWGMKAKENLHKCKFVPRTCIIKLIFDNKLMDRLWRSCLEIVGCSNALSKNSMMI